MDGYYYGQQENGHMVEAQASAARGEKRGWNCAAESSASGGGQGEQAHVKMLRPEPSVEASTTGAENVLWMPAVPTKLPNVETSEQASTTGVENALWMPAELGALPRVHGTGVYTPPGQQPPSVHPVVPTGSGQGEPARANMSRPEPSVEVSTTGAENALWMPAELRTLPRMHGTGVYSPPRQQQPSVPTVRCYPAVQSHPVAASVNDGADPAMQRAALQQYAAPEPRTPYTSLRCFDGNPLHWPEFQISWRETNRMYQDSDDGKRRRLRRALHGPALEHVQHLLLRRAPPRDIYRALHRRYHLISRDFFRLLKKAHDTARPEPANLLLMYFDFRNVLVELIHAFHLNKVHLVMNNTDLANYLAALLPVDFFRSWTLYFCNNDNVYGLLAFVQLKIYNIQRTAILLQLPDDSDEDTDD